MIAASRGNMSLVQCLLDNGANPNQSLKLADFLLLRNLKRWHHASRRPDAQVDFESSTAKTFSGNFGIFLQQQGDVARPDYSEHYAESKDLYAFEIAGACGHEDILKLLLSR